MAGGGQACGRLGLPWAAALGRISGDGKRRNIFSSTRGNPRWHRFALGGGGCDESAAAALWPAARSSAWSGGRASRAMRSRLAFAGCSVCGFIGARAAVVQGAHAKDSRPTARVLAAAASGLARWASPGLATRLAGAGRSGSGLRARPKRKG
jgi:hypothetical protein